MIGGRSTRSAVRYLSVVVDADADKADDDFVFFLVGQKKTAQNQKQCHPLAIMCCASKWIAFTCADELTHQMGGLTNNEKRETLFRQYFTTRPIRCATFGCAIKKYTFYGYTICDEVRVLSLSFVTTREALTQPRVHIDCSITHSQQLLNAITETCSCCSSIDECVDAHLIHT